jgi:hypothetical protein
LAGRRCLRCARNVSHVSGPICLRSVRSSQVISGHDCHRIDTRKSPHGRPGSPLGGRLLTGRRLDLRRVLEASPRRELVWPSRRYRHRLPPLSGWSTGRSAATCHLSPGSLPRPAEVLQEPIALAPAQRRLAAGGALGVVGLERQAHLVVRWAESVDLGERRAGVPSLRTQAQFLTPAPGTAAADRGLSAPASAAR